MTIWIFRALFLISASATAYSIGLGVGKPFPCLVAGILIGLLVVGAEWGLSRSPISVISSVVFGVLVGTLLSVLVERVVVLAFGPFPDPQYEAYVSLSLIVLFSYVSIAFIYQTRDKFRFMIPYVEFRREERGARPIVLDTSVIIDGRITDLLSTRVLDGPIVVPQAVLDELHHIADSEDKLKRERGRLGLETLNMIRENDVLDVTIQESSPGENRPVDEQLVVIAKKVNGRIMTNDYNLNRVAALARIDVINLNELANALKPIALPNEEISIKLIKRGEQPGQAVGFLEDGTMVVVEDAEHLVGEQVNAVVTNTITRETGRMIFAKTRRRQVSRAHGRRSR